MRKMKKVGLCVLMGALMITAAGCGKSQDSSETATGTDATMTDAVSEADAEETAFVDDGDWSTTEAEVSESEKFTTVEGAELLGFDFDDNDKGSFCTYTKGGVYTLTAENGELVCDIQTTGLAEHGCQLYYDGFTMAQGCVYTMQFDVRCDIERTIQWRIQINGGDYHLYAGEYVTIGPETQTVTCEFTMEEESDPAPRFCVNMGGMEGDGTLEAHKIYFDNISLVVTDSSNAQQIGGLPTPVQVKVNQVGYKPDDTKRVVVTSVDDDKYKIVTADTEETVYVAPYDESVYDDAIQGRAQYGDFSDFTTPGTYKIISHPSGASYEFTISDDVYDDAYKDVVLMLYKQRCGTDLDEDIAGDYTHDACHTGEAVVYGDEASGTVDVSGGWHDAGDYGRYVVPGAKTVQDLMLAYEDYDYTADDLGIPESGNGVPDLLDEARYELEWMLKMQNKESGGVYHKVTCAVFPETVMPEEETDQLILAPISYAATSDFAAVMAKASVVYAEYDKDFAKQCLEAAKLAYAYAESGEGMKSYKNPDDIVTGEYPDTKVSDEALWSAAELYLATGDDTYKKAVETCMEGSVAVEFGWADIGGYALYDLAKSDVTDESIKQDAADRIIAAADKHIEKCELEAFGTGLGKEYVWGSNMTVANNIELLLMANRLSANENYIKYAQLNRDYIFGLNPVGYCYVTGYGTNSPLSTHHRPSQVVGSSMPGMLVGGANTGHEDSYSNAVLTGVAPGLSYVDNEQSYSCNEVTIYWNSPLIYAMTGLNAQ
jgi:endoglucanase